MKRFLLSFITLLSLCRAGMSIGLAADPAPCAPTFPEATKTWTGTTDDSWHNPANWSPIGVPGADDHVVITGATNFSVKLNGSLQVASLRLGAEGGTATQTLLTQGQTLTFGEAGLVRSHGIECPRGAS